MRTTEQRYRRALRWYPAAWRQEHEEVVLGTLLDADADEGAARRSVQMHAEVAALALHGASARFAFFTNAETRSLAAAITLAAGFSYAVFHFVTSDLHPVRADLTGGRLGASALQMIPSVSWLLPMLWALAVAAAVLRMRTPYRTALFGIPITAMVILLPRLLEGTAGGMSRYALLFEAVAALLALVGVPAGRQVPAALLGWVTVFAIVTINNDTLRGIDSIWIWGLGPFNAAGLTIGLLVAMLILAVFIALNRLHAAGAVALAAIPWVVMLVAELATDRFNHFPPRYAATWLTFLALCSAAVFVFYRHRQGLILGSRYVPRSGARG